MVVLALGGFLVLVNLRLSRYEILGLWPLLLIVPGVVLLSLAVVVSPQDQRPNPLRPTHADDDYPEVHRGPLLW